MSAPSPLWLFAHRVLAGHFHQDPQRFVDVLDGRQAVAYLEQNWRSCLEAVGMHEPPKPPLRYGIDRPRDNLAIVWMSFHQVTKTGEPWHVRFVVRVADPGADNGYTRMFLLEHSEYASELAGKPEAIACESLAGGRHRNFGVTLAPTDESAFDHFVIETIRRDPQPAAELAPE